MQYRTLMQAIAMACLAAPILAQQPGQPSSATLPPHQSLLSTGMDTPALACPKFDNRERPVNTTIQARVTELMDSAHLKPGDDVFAKVLYGISYPGCELDQEAILYGHVTAAFASKDPKSSELGLLFDHADCNGKKQDLRMRLVGLVAPPDHTTMEHDVLPSEVHNAVQPLPVTSRAGIDDNLTPAAYPKTLRPGLVLRMNKVRLDPEGAPDCSARISSSSKDLRVAPGAELMFTVERISQPAQP
jgi:hypothetical protein